MKDLAAMTAAATTPIRKSAAEPMTFLWVINFDYPTRMHHGSTLRHVNYARELQASGHTVYFGVKLDPKYCDESRQWFTELREQRVISDFFELSYNPPPWRLRLAGITLHPYLANRILKSYQSGMAIAANEIVARLDVNVLILSDRQFWFLADSMTSLETTLLIDICDCVSLHLVRQMRRHVKARRFGRKHLMLRHLLYAVSEERYYARRGTAAMVVSPVDHDALTRIAGDSSRVVTLLNGVGFPPTRPGVQKIKNRLIFSGNMDFPPNHEAAIWFLDYVLPLVRKQVPDVQLVIAGANPLPCVKQRAGANVVVTGYVEDLDKEIARSSLYVAPMVSGSGFKNKVVEAIANRTYLVATPMAVEFLDKETRELIAVAQSPEQMAEMIVELLRNPTGCASRLSALYDRIAHDFSWSRRADELLEIIRTNAARKE
jgi:glycosyltransferase involved in cell wall biosynthesis